MGVFFFGWVRGFLLSGLHHWYIFQDNKKTQQKLWASVSQQEQESQVSTHLLTQLEEPTLAAVTKHMTNNANRLISAPVFIQQLMDRGGTGGFLLSWANNTSGLEILLA